MIDVTFRARRELFFMLAPDFFDVLRLSSSPYLFRENGHNDWQHKMPEAGEYNTDPNHSKFWQGDYKSDYGKAFMRYVSDEKNPRNCSP